MYFININITKHVLLSELENEKANVSCCFTCIADIKLNLAIAVLSRRKTWDDRFADEVRR